MFTRAQYMAGECTHAEYYGQYVVDEVKQKAFWFGKTNLIEAYLLDKNFNTIPLKKWDSLAKRTRFPPIVEDDYWTLAGKVCTLKEAARQIVEEAQNDHI